MSKILSSLTHSNTRLKTAAFWLVAVVLLAGLAAIFYWWAGRRPQSHYVTLEASMGEIERSVNVTGSINPRVTVQVGSYVSGTVKTLTCDFNTEVKAGQICATIDPSTFQVAVDQNAAQLNSTRAQSRKDGAALAYAKAVVERDSKLLADGIVAQEIVDNDKNVLQQALAQIDLDKAAIVAQQASLKSAMVNLGYTNIVSPVTGTVLTRNIDVGQTVASSLQTPTLFLIGKDLTKMQVDANVSEADVGRIKVDQEVTFSVQAYPERIFSGSVKQIRRGPITVQNVVTYDVVVAVDNPDLLLFPGMTADAEIVIDARENALRIPLAAVRFAPERAGHRSQAHTGGASGSGNRGDGQSDVHNHDSAEPAMSADGPRGKHGASAAEHDKTERNGGTQVAHQGHGEHGKGGSETANDTRAQQFEKSGANGGQGGRHHGGQRGQQGGANGPDEKHSVVAINEAAPTSPAPPLAEKARRQKRSKIWILRGTTPQPLWITTGLDNGELVEVLSGGLKAGDMVIVNEVRPVEAKIGPAQGPFGQVGRRGHDR